jgi:DNA/RNA-binding domain of Phe-tRNA-synthetase-like protein
MRFSIDKEVFELFPNLCIGIVTAYKLNNSQHIEEIEELLNNQFVKTHNLLKDSNCREHPNIKIWRDAFQKVNTNPNKYPPSIEALSKRICKKPFVSIINPVVDLSNTLSLKYMLPMGAHDIDKITGGMIVRFSKQGDVFTPFGSSETEEVEAGEIVYADDKEIKTRKWIWRQSEKGKITSNSTNIFFPIDGFKPETQNTVLLARDELSDLIKRYFHCKVACYFADINNPEIIFD